MFIMGSLLENGARYDANMRVYTKAVDFANGSMSSGFIYTNLAAGCFHDSRSPILSVLACFS